FPEDLPDARASRGHRGRRTEHSVSDEVTQMMPSKALLPPPPSGPAARVPLSMRRPAAGRPPTGERPVFRGTPDDDAHDEHTRLRPPATPSSPGFEPAFE